MEFPLELEKGVEVRKALLSRYRFVYPYKNKDGSINWFNLITGGSWGNLLKVALIVLMVLALTGAYLRDIRVYKQIAIKCTKEPCKWCQIVREAQQNQGLGYGTMPNMSDLLNNLEIVEGG